MARNLRLLPWYWVLRWAWLGNAIWVIYLTTERGLSLGAVFMFEAFFAAVSTVAELPTGAFADRYGRRASMLIGALGITLSMTIFGIAHNAAVLLTSYLTWGIAFAFLSGADDAFMFDTLRALHREAEFTRINGRLNGIVSIWAALLSVAGSLLAALISLAAPILASAVFSLAAAVLVWQLAEPPRALEQRGSILRTTARAARHVAREPALRWLVALVALVGVGSEVVFTTFQPIARGYGVPVGALGVFAVANSTVMAVGGWSAHRIEARLGMTRTIGVCALFGTATLLAGAVALPPLYAVLMLSLGAWQVLYPLAVDYLSRHADDEMRASVLSIRQMLMGALWVALLPVIALAADGAGVRAAVLAAGVTLTTLAVGAYLLWLRAERAAGAPAAAT